MEGELVNGTVCWQILADPMLVQVFQHLSAGELLHAGQTCTHWHRVSRDETLWRRLIHRDFDIDPSVEISPGCESWRDEYKRLHYHIPTFCSEQLKLSCTLRHVSFAHNGTMFATSLEAAIIVWNSDYPVSEKYRYTSNNFNSHPDFNWDYTQFSQFNQSDTMLLVTGVDEDWSVVAVFSLLDNFKLTNYVVNCQYDIFGTWCSDHHFLHGFIWSVEDDSPTEMWLKSANCTVKRRGRCRGYPSPEICQSEHISRCEFIFEEGLCDTRMRNVMLANCVNTDAPLRIESEASSMDHKHVDEAGIPHCSLARETPSSSTHHNTERQWSEQDQVLDKDGPSDKVEGESKMSAMSMACDNKVIVEKYLIYTRNPGSEGRFHQIGMKRIKQVVSMAYFKCNEGAELLYGEDMSMESYCNTPPCGLDTVEHVIDVHGHIVGMALSPDHRYLYVNRRPLLADYHTKNRNPIAEEIDIHVIDLLTLEDVATLRGHQAYSELWRSVWPEALDIFIDVCDYYVASGSEDNHGYLWDRYYHVCLAKYPHNDIVRSVAFNPQDSGMLVTTSEDCTVRVWRSRAQLESLLGAAEINDLPRAIKLKVGQQNSEKLE